MTVHHQEAQDHQIEMSEDDPDALEMFLDWLYTMDRLIPATCFSRYGVTVLMHLGQQAVKFDQPLLLETIVAFIEAHPTLGFKQGLIAWKETKDMGDNLLVKRMRDVLAERLMAAHELVELDSGCRDILKETPELGIELVQRLAKERKDKKEMKTPAPAAPAPAVPVAATAPRAAAAAPPSQVGRSLFSSASPTPPFSFGETKNRR